MKDKEKGVVHELHPVFNKILKCKNNRSNCPELKRRELFFEPNPHTLERWREEHKFYKKGVDLRVVFVCESPGGQFKEKLYKFETDGFEGRQCYNLTSQDKRFREVREKNGFQDCYITNSVKCGVRDPNKKKIHDDEELAKCSKFLIEELEILKPLVVACVGGNAFFAMQNYVVPELSFSPVVLEITHYSFRGDPSARWKNEFKRIKQCLRSHNYSEDEPLF